MAIFIHTKRPETLLKFIINKISESRVIEWDYENEHFIYKPGEWKSRGYFTAYYCNFPDCLIFGFTGICTGDNYKDTYEIYHSQFEDLLLKYFQSAFTGMEIKSDVTWDKMIKSQ